MTELSRKDVFHEAVEDDDLFDRNLGDSSDSN